MWYFPSGSAVKNPPAMQETHKIPGLGRSLGVGKGNPLQYSSLKNPMDRGDWWLTFQRVAKVRYDWAHTHTHTKSLLMKHFLALLFFGIRMKTDLFQSHGYCWVFQICWHIGCYMLTASSFRISNSSAGIPSPLLALFIAMLSESHLTSQPGCLALGEWSHHCAYPVH